MSGKTAKEPSSITLTEAKVRDLPLPDAGRVRIRDAFMSGLCLRLTPGKKVWSWRYSKQGRGKGFKSGDTQEVTLGEWPALTVVDARRLAQVKAAERAEGGDPAATVRAIREESTLQELWKWFDRHHVARLRASTQRRYRDSWRLHLDPALGKRTLSSIESDAVQDMVDAITSNAGPGASKHAVAVLAAMYHSAQESPTHKYKGQVPTVGVMRPKLASRSRFLQAGELPRFFNALRAEPRFWVAFWSCCLFTGLRRSNVASAEWANVNLDGARWFVPGESSKNGDPLFVPIPAPLVDLLREWRAELSGLLADVNERRAHLLARGDANGKNRKPLATAEELKVAGAYLFPALLMENRPSKTPHLVEVKGSWRRILAHAKLSNLRPHDLRRSIGSWMAIGGSSMAIIGQALGHKDVQSTQVYARLSMDPVRAAVEGATQAMIAAGDGKPRKKNGKAKK